MQCALTGLYLNREPIFFDEGGLPDLRMWHTWLQHHRRFRLTLLANVVANVAETLAIDHINITLSADGAKPLRRQGCSR